VSMCIYVVAIPMAFVRTWICVGCWVVVALTWLYPDRRIESAIERARPETSD
jgi:hypothetical protein